MVWGRGGGGRVSGAAAVRPQLVREEQNPELQPLVLSFASISSYFASRECCCCVVVVAAAVLQVTFAEEAWTRSAAAVAIPPLRQK